MQTGAITEYIDVAQLVLYAFWVFFAGLIYYLHQENKREGYPLESNVPGKARIEGFPPVPSPKTFLLADGTTMTVPRPTDDEPSLREIRTAGYPGSPLEPTGDAMHLGVGPGSISHRRDIPDMTVDGQNRIVPLRTVGDFHVSDKDTDPRGLPVLGSDGALGGVVRDVWVDRAEVVFRYLEVDVGDATTVAMGSSGSTTATASIPATIGDETRHTVLVPFNFARIGSRSIVVDSLVGANFAGVPKTRQPDVITFLEEEKVMAYYGAGTLYATAGRAEPLL